MTESLTMALVDRCLAGDDLALRAFVERFQQQVFGLCLRMLGHRQDAEDVAQEVLLRAVKYLANWDRSRPLEPWVLTIAANRCRTARVQRRKRPFDSSLVANAAAVENSTNDLAEELDRALEQLRPEYRETFVLFYQQEWSIREIGVALDVPEGTVKTWLHRARKELAGILSERGLAPWGAVPPHLSQPHQ